MTGGLVILVPVLDRPQNVRPLLDSIAAATPDPYRVLFIVDPDDVAEREAVRRARSEHVHSTLLAGGYARKINAGIRATHEPLIFLGADDLDFKPGWLGAALAKLEPGIGVVGTNDLGNERVKRGEHATHSLVTREYAELGTIDEPGKLLHEGYHHWKVDDELVATAKHRGAWAFAKDSRVEHLHPYWKKAPMDDTYRKGEEQHRLDARRFRKRVRLWS